MNLVEGCDCMKKFFRVFCCGTGGALIGFYAKLLDTTSGCLFFTLGVLLLVGSLISISKEAEKDKEEK